MLNQIIEMNYESF